MRLARIAAIYKEDEGKPIRKSHNNPEVTAIYEEYLKKPLGEKSHHLLHTQLHAAGTGVGRRPAEGRGRHMGIVSTIPEKCRRCYACVRECPVKAIKVIAGQATVIAEQCIACGNCVKVCTQKAKRIEDATMLRGRRRDKSAEYVERHRSRSSPPPSPSHSRDIGPGQHRQRPAPPGILPRCGKWHSAQS